MADTADTLLAATTKVDNMSAEMNAGNEFLRADGSAGTKNRDKTDAWKNDADTSDQLVEIGNNETEMENFTGENSTERKYRNLYSVSAIAAQNGGQQSSWNPFRTAALANALLANKLDHAKTETKSLLVTLREQLATYQESYGIPRSEYTFPALVKVMGQATGKSLLALLYVVVHIIPMAQILLHILRFVLDKTISIQNTNDLRRKVFKYAILGLQLLCIYVCLVFIFGLIVMPILYIALGILVKIMLYD